MTVRIHLALCLALTAAGCDTKEKLDRTLDEGHAAATDARATMKNVNAKLDKLDSLLTKLGDATGGGAGGTKAFAAAAAIANTGAQGGNVPAQGGAPKTSSDSIDVDGDGQADDVTAVDYGETILWLIPVANADESFCGAATTVNWVLTDNSPTTVLSFGQWDSSCGTVACPDAPSDDYDFEGQCGCQDTAGASIACDAFAAPAEGGGQDAEGGGQGEEGEESGDGAEGGDEEGELTCDDLVSECETACADAESDDEFDACIDGCLEDEGC